MSFRHRNLKGVGYNHSGQPAVFTYFTDTDSLSDVEVAGYFDDPQSDMVEGDFIMVRASDGNLIMRMEAASTATTLTGGETGWGKYIDTTYTSGSPLAVVADTDTTLPNNKGTVIETQLPPDVVTFYNGTVIGGDEGDALSLTFDMDVIPTDVNGTLFEIWIDVGGAIGELYRESFTFPRGQDVNRHVNFSFAAGVISEWGDNGATPKIRCNGTANVYGIEYIVTRTHKAR